MVRLSMRTVRLSEPILGLGYEQFVDYDPKYPPTLGYWEILVTTFIANREQLAVEMLPKGWRYLETGEVIMAGDKELRHYGDWKVVNSTGVRYNRIGFAPHIRKVMIRYA